MWCWNASWAKALAALRSLQARLWAPSSCPCSTPSSSSTNRTSWCLVVANAAAPGSQTQRSEATEGGESVKEKGTQQTKTNNNKKQNNPRPLCVGGCSGLSRPRRRFPHTCIRTIETIEDATERQEQFTVLLCIGSNQTTEGVSASSPTCLHVCTAPFLARQRKHQGPCRPAPVFREHFEGQLQPGVMATTQPIPIM
mgnify:CR=1 FL=1